MSGGGTSKSNQTTQQVTKTEQNPWDPAIPGLKGIASAATNLVPQAGTLSPLQTQALDSMQANANAGNPYAGRVAGLADELFTGGKDRTGIAQSAYDDYKAQSQPYLSANYTDPYKNPAFQAYLDTTTNDIANRVNGMFAGAGRDMSGMNFQTLARGITEGTAPIFANQYNALVGQQQAAMNGLYGAGNTTAGTLSNLDQTALGNKGVGVSVADAALAARDQSAQRTLEIEAQRQGIPVSQLAQVTGILGSVGSMGGTGQSNGWSNTQGQYTMAPVQQAVGWTQALYPKSPVKT